MDILNSLKNGYTWQQFIVTCFGDIATMSHDDVNSFKHILESSKLKELADDNFKVIGKVEFLSKCRNNVGKGEIAYYEQFLLFPRCFPKTCTADM